jgi:hypothetical protein
MLGVFGNDRINLIQAPSKQAININYILFNKIYIDNASYHTFRPTDIYVAGVKQNL